MYNSKYEPQLDKFRRNLFGGMSPRQASADAHRRYCLPDDVKTIPCKENEHGEWVPCIEDTVSE
jgi:hypothetical protein